LSIRVSLRFLETGSEYPITTQRFRIGRGSDNDVVIADSTLSRHHAEIVYETGDYCLRDLDSMNGTFVNGRLVSGDCILGDGDIIAFGSAPKMIFVVEDQTQYWPDGRR
jgi:pSer/pThr/pTyr-binding forkhead associated (FHA) protein